uniref:Uncharacterized protein n=1 Tax=Candidatus Kentrum sp. TC TaxID=2126339 RepID=A0A450ZG51_9GAMM|nr:MAG: hypothetical protein BECKTC1821D_GA0114238_12072 [Candidatus Kentron sp. TC]
MNRFQCSFSRSHTRCCSVPLARVRNSSRRQWFNWGFPEKSSFFRPGDRYSQGELNSSVPTLGYSLEPPPNNPPTSTRRSPSAGPPCSMSSAPWSVVSPFSLTRAARGPAAPRIPGGRRGGQSRNLPVHRSSATNAISTLIPSEAARGPRIPWRQRRAHP